MGIKVQDTVELSFDDVRVPVANRLGEEGAAFGYLGHNLAQERITVAVGSVAQARAALDTTVEYVKERKVFGTPVASFQNTKFELAAMSAEFEAGQTMVDRAVLDLVDDELSGPDAAKVNCSARRSRRGSSTGACNCSAATATWPSTRSPGSTSDARMTRIYAGTSEVMKVIIAKSLGL